MSTRKALSLLAAIVAIVLAIATFVTAIVWVHRESEPEALPECAIDFSIDLPVAP